MNPSLQSLFPNASESCHAANPQLSPAKATRNAIEGILANARPYSKKMLMNKTESGFAQRLEIMKRNGEILRYDYQGMTLRWGVDEKTGDSMRYTPDFVVFKPKTIEVELNSVQSTEIEVAPTIVLIEVKGPHIHYRQQAIARFKGCRAWWPEFQFEMWQKQKTGWKQIL